MGSGPFGPWPAGRFNFDAPRAGVFYVEGLERWVRGRLDGETAVDSKRPRLLHEHGRLPLFLFSEDDVRSGLLEPTGETDRDEVKGERELLTVAGSDGGAWRWREGELSGLIGFDWHAMDEWLDEDEPLLGHARDPYSRIDVRDTSRHVRVLLDGEVLADTRRSKVLFESGLPPRWYIPEEDVRMELLEPTDARTTCAYKGHASYWSVGDAENVVWTYRDPEQDAQPVKDMLCFWNERVDIELDGQPEERPHSPFSA